MLIKTIFISNTEQTPEKVYTDGEKEPSSIKVPISSNIRPGMPRQLENL